MKNGKNKTKDELMEMVRKKPLSFIEYLEKHNVNFDDMADEMDLGRTIVQKRFDFKDDTIKAVEFIFWYSYYVEREARDLIIEPEVELGARKDAMELIIDKLYFGDKISLIADLYTSNPKKDLFIKHMRQVQDLRNKIAHGRFDALKYKDMHISGADAQMVMIADLMNALLSNKKN